MKAKASSLISAAAFFIFNVKGFLSKNLVRDRIQVLHACASTTAYIPWPLPLQDQSDHDSAHITLLFQHTYSEKQFVIADFKGKKVSIRNVTYYSKISVSKEHSGMFLKSVDPDIAGIFTVELKKANGDLWTRQTELVVLVPPEIKYGLSIDIINSAKPTNGRKDCVTVECGKVGYPGHPAVKYVWRNMTSVLNSETASLWYSSRYQVCSPFHGLLTCSIGGLSSICTFNHVASIFLDLPVNSSSVQGESSSNRDLILMIVMPVLAIGIPLLILGIWVCTHLLKTYPQYRDQKHLARDVSKEHNHVFASSAAADLGTTPSISFHSHHELPPPILEDLNETESIATIETSNRLIGLHSPPKQYRDPEETEKKGSLLNDDEDDDDEEEDDSDEEDDDEEEEDEEEDGEGDDDDDDDDDDGIDQQNKEKQPLMEDSIHPIAV